MPDFTREGSHKPFDAVRRLSVIVARGVDAGRLARTESGEACSIGTAEDNDLVLSDPTVSRYHLQLTPTAEGIAVRDLASTNGTFVAGVRVREAVVARGAQLKIGGAMIVVDSADTESHAPKSAIELPEMVFVSERMGDVARRVQAVATLTSAVLVQGETGTGKELVTRAIHDLGPRKDGPFVIVDCGSLPPTLLEAELFGHERGAFTGADRAREGAFERANGGTIVLDEVGELPLVAQATLLGVLERRRFRRVGGNKEIASSFRLVSSTNRDLRLEVNREAFRADLYYRLAGTRIVLPALRERPEDIPALVRHFARELTGSEDVPRDLLDALSRQTWPGNVRELRAAVERVLAFGAEGLFDDLALEPHGSEPPHVASGDPRRYRDAKAAAIEAFDRAYLGTLLEGAAGNVSEAARRARMDRPYLIALLKRYGLRG